MLLCLWLCCKIFQFVVGLVICWHGLNFRATILSYVVAHVFESEYKIIKNCTVFFSYFVNLTLWSLYFCFYTFTFAWTCNVWLFCHFATFTYISKLKHNKDYFYSIPICHLNFKVKIDRHLELLLILSTLTTDLVPSEENKP